MHSGVCTPFVVDLFINSYDNNIYLDRHAYVKRSMISFKNILNEVLCYENLFQC